MDRGFGMGQKSGSGSGMNNPDHHTSESLEAICLVKILKFFNADPGWKKFGSGMNIRIRNTENVPPGTAGVALDHLCEKAAHRRLGEQGSAALLSLLHTHNSSTHYRAAATIC